MGALRHCGRCHKTTAHVNDECQRCIFLKAHRVRKPMTEEAKAKLKELNERRKREREARKRDKFSTTEGN